MQHAPPAPHALAFIRGLIRSSIVLTDLLDGLIEQCEVKDAFPGEDVASVVVEMAAGSVAVRLRHVPPAEFEQATELMELALDGILADLAAAAELARRRTNGYRLTAS
jgi:hypothetical protein